MADKHKSIEQERAAYAWECVAGGVNKEYVNLAKRAPALIMQNGLMQALAFYKAKGHDRLTMNITGWLQRRKLIEQTQFDSVMKELSGTTADQYMRATEETLEILRWIRQFASASASAREA